MYRRVAIAALLLAPLTLSGCGWIQPPRLLGPGPVGYQQQWAAHFDPYPDDSFGPEVVGGRPRGFQNPVSKPEYDQPFSPLPYFPTSVGYPPSPGYVPPPTYGQRPIYPNIQANPQFPAARGYPVQ